MQTHGDIPVITGDRVGGRTAIAISVNTTCS